jgi:hypothetical protein
VAASPGFRWPGLFHAAGTHGAPARLTVQRLRSPHTPHPLSGPLREALVSGLGLFLAGPPARIARWSRASRRRSRRRSDRHLRDRGDVACPVLKSRAGRRISDSTPLPAVVPTSRIWEERLPGTGTAAGALSHRRAALCRSEAGRNEIIRCGHEKGEPALRYPTTGTAGCCARAAGGHAAAPPSPAMKSRRRILDPSR